MSSLCIIGAGAWGTALATHATRLGHRVTIVARNQPAPDHADAILLCMPTQSLRGVLALRLPPAPLLLCCKGIETGTGKLPLEIVADCLPNHPALVLTGPNFASGIAAGHPAAAIIAGSDAALRENLIALLAAPTFRLYGNTDPIGAQLGGAAKNVIAIAAGIVIGAGHGENARAALITRGLAELSRLIESQGGRPETAAGLSGLGDLVLTCTSPTSRNFSHGLAVGSGTIPPANRVVEGIATAAALLTRAAGLDLPICTAVADLLANRLTVPEAVASLLARKRRDEA